MTNYYTKTSPSISYYSGTTGSEPDLRQELINTLDGRYPEVAKRQYGLLRQMNTDSNGDLVPCGCVDSITHEPDKDRWCPICHGDGYIWEESLITFYRVLKDSEVDNILRDKMIGPGLINIPLVVFYIRYSTTITKNDKIVELVLNNAGSPGSSASDYVRRKIYKVEAVWEYRADNGRLEYYKVFAHVEDVKHLNPPSYGDIVE